MYALSHGGDAPPISARPHLFETRSDPYRRSAHRSGGSCSALPPHRHIDSRLLSAQRGERGDKAGRLSEQSGAVLTSKRCSYQPAGPVRFDIP